MLFALTLPPDAAAAVEAKYPGFRMAPAAPQIEQWFREYGFASSPGLVAADFDQDGEKDWAVQVITPRGRQVTVALLRRGGRWELHALSEDAPDPFRYLLLFEKGDKDFDFRTLKPFRHTRDAVGVMHFNRTPVVYTWRNGRFRSALAPSDEE